MAKQPPLPSVTNEMKSFMMGYHSYMDVWEPQVREVLALKREPQNFAYQFAASVVRSGHIVGHFPFNFAHIFSQFLKRSFNKGTAEITVGKVNCDGGYVLEVLCIHRLYGPKTYVERAMTLHSSDQSQVQCSGVSVLSENRSFVLRLY